MKVEVEFRSAMSRRELFQALQIGNEAARRLAHRMTAAELDRVASAGAALMEVANEEYARRRPALSAQALIPDADNYGGV